MRDYHYPALSHFTFVCAVMAWLSLLVGAIGVAASLWWMSPQRPFDGWMMPTLIASVIASGFWFFAFRALAEYLILKADQANALRELVGLLRKQSAPSK